MLSDANSNVASFKIFLNNTELESSLEAAILQVKVEDAINWPSMFSIRLNIIDFKNCSWRGVELKEFQLGDTISISMGFNQLKKMLEGRITALEPNFSKYSFMDIRGYDQLYLFNFGTHTRVFNDLPDSEIATSIAEEFGLTAYADLTTIMNSYICQNNQTNYSFLLSRCHKLNYEMYVNGNSFHFIKSNEGKEPLLKLEYNIDVIEVDFKMRVLTAGSNIKVLNWDMLNKRVVTCNVATASPQLQFYEEKTGAELSSSFPTSELTYVSEDSFDEEAAMVFAQAKYDEELKYFIEGDGYGIGNPSLRAGINIYLNGLGSCFSGIYYVTATEHIFDQKKGYITYFKLRRTGI